MEMPCFSPENVVFITNKWDLVRKQIDNSEEDSSESDNEEEIGIWKQLKMDIKQEWPYVGEENIFKMILKDVIIFFSSQYILIKHNIIFTNVVMSDIK